MADIIYTVNQDSPESIEGFEQYSQEDRALVSSFQINNVFDPTKNYSELHILSLSDELLESIYDYNGYKQASAAQSAGQEGTSALTIDPVEDSKTYGYTNGGIKLLYHFLDDLYSQDKSRAEFYIQEISADRTELSLNTLNISSEELVSITSAIKTKLESQSYFTGFRLNFRDNDLLIGTNIDTLDSPTGKVVVVKLYEPLPINYQLKSILTIVDIVSDSVAYEIDVEYVLPPVLAPTLRSPNFNIDITDYSVVPTGYYDYNELFSYPVNNSNSQIYSTVKEKSIDISVDYTDFNDFVHFSSAQERLLNFKYKVDLISSYSASLATISAATTGIQGISGSKDYYQNLITGVVGNFDHYERYLYYESGSGSWPKSNTTKPYINKVSTAPEAVTWYSNQITNAIEYDQTNYNSLAYSIPTYLRDDANNENYLTFIYMVGQHFDNLWLYAKAVTDKYDADNRIGYGISKDLVAEALENFGVKLYTSNKSIEDLFTTFIGQAYQSGSEQINVYVTGSLTGSNAHIQPVSYDDYQKEVQKRIYHNLPLLLKSKGTERGLRALINCFGIPGDILDIKLYGGRNRNERPFYGDYTFYTSSLDKIRLDNTGSIVSGSTLSNYVSIVKRDDKYTDDLHPIEVGFSPTDNVDNYIKQSLTSAQLPSVTIGTQVWTNENLDVTTYRNGDTIPQVTDGTAWAALTTGAWCYYENRTDSGSVYSKMYNWYAVNDPRGLAPQGWHVPSAAEFTTLSTFLGGDSVAGGKLKSTGTSLWQSPNSSATNDSGFTGLPGGYRFSNGVFYGINQVGLWWSSTQIDATTAFSRQLSSGNGVFSEVNYLNKKGGFSVRLVQDTTSNTFNIDDYIGDPSNLYLNNYSGLEAIATTVLSGSLGASGSYDLRDYVRLIKFYDNTIFKMVKDFMPARTVADTGIIIKPNLLNRSKAKSVIATGSRPEYSGSIDTAFVSGRSPNTFKTGGTEASTQYYDFPQTPTGIGITTSHYQDEAKYNGEISGSTISISNVNLNSANIYKDLSYSTAPYQVNFISASNEVCLLGTVPTPFYITSSTAQWNANQFFTFTNPNFIYSASNDLVPTTWTPITFPRPFPVVQLVPVPQGYFQDFLIKATNRDITVGPVCTTNIQVRFATCSIFLSTLGLQTTNVVTQGLTGTVSTNITNWFSNPNQQTLQYTASYSTSSAIDPITNPTQYLFNQKEGTRVTITANDANLGGICKVSTTVYVGACTLGKRPYNQTNQQVSRGFEFAYSRWQALLWEAGDPLTEIDPETGETLQIDYSSPGAVVLQRTLPPVMEYVAGNRRYRGIQEYFTLNGTLGTQLTMNPAIRYDIYELYNTSGNPPNTPPNEDRYRLVPVARGINPATPPNTWGAGNLAVPVGYTFENTENLSDPTLYGYNNAFYPIVLITPEYNMTYYPVGSGEGATPQFIDVPKGTLIRAYVIEAYREGQENCRQQVVIYGDKTTLIPSEGVGTQAQFFTKNILVNWNYDSGFSPTVTFPTPSPDPAFGPWITTTIRRWGDTAIGTPPQ